MHTLTNDQRLQIAVFVIDEYGTQLTSDDVGEIIGLVLENISGVGGSDISEIIKDIRSLYYEKIDNNSADNKGQ